MSALKPVYVFVIFLLLSFTGFSQPVSITIDSIVNCITPDSYRTHFDSLRTSKGCNRKVIEADFQSSDHDACRDYIYRTLKKYLGEDNVYLHHFAVDKFEGLANVIGFKKGKSPTKEILIVSAHYDTNNSNEEGDLASVCSPGANDNGTGLATVLEIARVLSEVETDYSVLFAAWDFEEQFTYGFAGGSNRWYNDHIVRKKNMDWDDFKFGGKLNIDQVMANVNFDMFGHPNDTIDGKPVLWACSGNVMHSSFVKEYVSTLNRYVPEIAVVNHGKMAYSDHYTFAARKIPSVENLESGYDKDPYYHTCLDNLENRENVNFDFAVHVARGGMAFTLEKAQIIVPSVVKEIDDSSSIIIDEKFDAYYLKVPKTDYGVLVVDPFGNQINTFRENDLFIFYPPVGGLYGVFVFGKEGRVSRNIYLQKKEGHVPFSF